MAKRQHVGTIYFMDGSTVSLRPQFLTQKDFTLEELQLAVGGYIERYPVTLKSKGTLYCNEDGIGLGLRLNAAVDYVELSKKSAAQLGHIYCVGDAIETFTVEGGPG